MCVGILCPLCGVVVAQVTILWCKECGRYLQPPKHWVRAEPESKELLTFCTKRIKGLQVRGMRGVCVWGGRGRWGFGRQGGEGQVPMKLVCSERLIAEVVGGAEVAAWIAVVLYVCPGLMKRMCVSLALLLVGRQMQMAQAGGIGLCKSSLFGF
jgi:hypothetical protein